jgi:hypothetical protein
MTKKIKLFIIVYFTLSTFTSKSQVLISLLFGKSLNSPNIEFGMAGGLNRSYMKDIAESTGVNNFHLGFYFHILIKNNSYLSTGAIIKSNVGATGMSTYSVGDAAFDSLYKDGTLTKKLSYLYVPVMFHQRFNNKWYLEAGPNFGVRTKAKDIFDVSSLGGDQEYTKDVKDEYTKLDAGIMAGVGYKLKNEPKSMAVGVNYYYGLVDVSKSSESEIKNSSIYFYIKIPIGVGKTEN